MKVFYVINNDYWVDKSLSQWKKNMIVSAKCKI